MNLRKKLLSTSAAVALGLAGLIGAAAPAQAATITVTDADCTSSQVTTGAAISAAPGDILDFTSVLTSCKDATLPQGLVASVSDITVEEGGTSVQVQSSSGFYSASTVIDGNSGDLTLFRFTVGPTNGTFTVSMSDAGAFPNFKSTEWTVTVTGGGGGDNGSSSAAAATPQTFELSLTPTDGTTCTNSSESGRAGTWMTLPGANDCTPPATQANANLLGWATIPNFPVAIAQRQVNNGWGAYEIFNDEGQLTAVFIPAGGATFLSGSGQLYPIWSE